MTFLAKPSAALGFGAFFLCAATCAHFDETLLSLTSDWTAGVVFVVGGVLSGRSWLRGRQYQVVGWAFMVSLLLRSFLGNLEDLGDVCSRRDRVNGTRRAPARTISRHRRRAASGVGGWPANDTRTRIE